MNTREDYKQKIEGELALAQAKLAEFKARAEMASADTRISYNEHMNDMEQKFDTAKSKLKDFGEASDGAWENMKDGVESAWHSLSDSVKDAAAKFKS
ncbi:MAG: hypothetical protein BWK73_33030 [Thiothrix lacustris]|uniref:Coiled coil domain-containing protein n=1 Tax=Thiothrix lacustris TaxID=525917 RepID=A0A1Y1QHQ3_9GAMM|nr:MAG: hypothetical protein BWK73_33030 [Thiothrix lacustris]